MASSLSSIIDSHFVNRFVGAAMGSASSAVTSAASGQSNKSLYNGLRYGAQVYSTSYQALNATISFTHLGKSSLKSLEELTDKMITLVGRATQLGAGEENRKQIQLQFRKLAGQFRDIVNNTKIGGHDALNKEGLSDILTNVGLNSEQADSIASIFTAFDCLSSDPVFASEAIRARRPVDIPPSAFRTPPSSTVYTLKQISNADVNGGRGGISTGGSAYQTQDNILNQNPGIDSVFTSAANGSISGPAAGTLTDGMRLLRVNESNGYMVVESRDNLYKPEGTPDGFNQGGFDQLYLLDSTGRVVRQITDNADAAVAYISADLSKDNLTAAYVYDNGVVRTLEVAAAASLDQAPTAATVSFQTGGYDVKINNDGTTVAFDDTQSDLKLADAATGAITTTGLMGLAYGFINSTTVASLCDGNDIVEYNQGVTTYIETPTVNDITHFSTLEKDAALAASGYYSYIEDNGNLAIKQCADDGSTATAYSANLGSDAGSSALLMTMAYRANGRPEIGITGQLSNVNGDNDMEAYRLTYNPLSERGALVSLTQSQPAKLLDASFSKRPDAYQLLADLKRLKSQIKKNQKAFENAEQVISDNMELVRQAGLTMLDISKQITTKNTAEEVAKMVADGIRKNAPGYLSQIENLNNAAAAAIALASDGGNVFA